MTQILSCKFVDDKGFAKIRFLYKYNTVLKNYWMGTKLLSYFRCWYFEDKIQQVLYNTRACLFKTFSLEKLIEALVAEVQTSWTASQWLIQFYNFASLYFLCFICSAFLLYFLFQCIFKTRW